MQICPLLKKEVLREGMAGQSIPPPGAKAALCKDFPVFLS